MFMTFKYKKYRQAAKWRITPQGRTELPRTFRGTFVVINARYADSSERLKRNVSISGQYSSIKFHASFLESPPNASKEAVSNPLLGIPLWGNYNVVLPQTQNDSRPVKQPACLWYERSSGGCALKMHLFPHIQVLNINIDYMCWSSSRMHGLGSLWNDSFHPLYSKLNKTSSLALWLTSYYIAFKEP